MYRIISLILIASWGISAQAQDIDPRTGLLVMAHGGSDEWNAAVERAVDPLRASYPVSIAFGMANSDSLEKSVRALEGVGVSSISVVRLFISANSFLPETEFSFHLRKDIPDGHYMNSPRAIRLNSPVKLSVEGLLDAAPVGEILADRAMSLRVDPEQETVLIIGHGPSSDTENEDWIRKMNLLANSVRRAAPFHGVIVHTLREDWTGKRKVVELELRELLQDERAAGRTVLVIPFRLYGFGPYAEVLDGLEYRADSTGFLPDVRITSWISEQFDLLSSGTE